ncbi:MAG: glycosyltransferase family 2 protein, partial [Paenibacillaceae bacterium]|nr:glycosyltransferase family 2 protein [Paenibacillaceae bacterium]
MNLNAQRILVIIPAYNEEASIGAVIREIQDHVPEADILVVNDGSSDRTANCAREAGAKVLTLPYNVGIGGGMQTGYLYAKEMGYDIAVQMDADGQHPAGELRSLIAGVAEQDLVIGSRFLGAASFRSSAARRVGIAFFS